MPVLPYGERLEAIAADVEPHRRVECHFLSQEHMGELVVEGGRVLI